LELYKLGSRQKALLLLIFSSFLMHLALELSCIFSKDSTSQITNPNEYSSITHNQFSDCV